MESSVETEFQKADEGIRIASWALDEFKENISKHGFPSIKSEIKFFRETKCQPMKYLIHYTEVRFCELRISKLRYEKQLDFLDDQIKKVDRFFSRHIEFLLYMEQGYTHFDEHYFTRKYLNDNPVVKSYPYYKDPTFNTSHDEIWARIKGLAMYGNYLKTKGLKIKNGCTAGCESHSDKELFWTGSYAAFVELVYGLQAMGYINQGNTDTKKIIDIFSDLLSLPQGNHSRTYNELKDRKGSRIKFFEDAGQRLLQKMDLEDGFD